MNDHGLPTVDGSKVIIPAELSTHKKRGPKRKLPEPITPERLAASGTEDGHQKALFCWASSWRIQEIYPDLRWMFHIPNGGHRHKAVALELKAMGTKKGVQDICLPIRRGDFAALWIELKIPKQGTKRAGRLREEQTPWRDHMRSQGHAACVCRGWEEARRMIIDYLEWKG